MEQPAPKSSAESAELKQQLCNKDRQIQGLAAQLNSAGMKLEFKRAKRSERGRPLITERQEGQRKGKEGRES